jgi:hypothetical protein
MRHTAQMSHTVHTTRLYKCYTQPVWLNKHSTKKKEELYVLKGQYRWQLPCQQHQCDLSWLSSMLISLTLLLFSLSEMTMRTSLLHTEQWAVWSCHLQLSQHSLKCFDVWWHFKKNVISCVWQLTTAEINTLWLWIRIALMYDNWWVLIWFSVTHCCTNKMFTLSSTRMTIVWREWV